MALVAVDRKCHEWIERMWRLLVAGGFSFTSIACFSIVSTVYQPPNFYLFVLETVTIILYRLSNMGVHLPHRVLNLHASSLLRVHDVASLDPLTTLVEAVWTAIEGKETTKKLWQQS